MHINEHRCYKPANLCERAKHPLKELRTTSNFVEQLPQHENSQTASCGTSSKIIEEMVSEKHLANSRDASETHLKDIWGGLAGEERNVYK